VVPIWSAPKQMSKSTTRQPQGRRAGP